MSVAERVVRLPEKPTAPYATRPGSHVPPGAHADAGGVNFSIFVRDDVDAELCLYAHAEDPAPMQVIRLSPDLNRTYLFWHVYVEQLPPGTFYTWRCGAHGCKPEELRELLDPWARATSDRRWDRRASIAGNIAGNSLRAIVCEPLGEPAPFIPPDDTEAVIYEMHVGGFTRHPSSGVHHPGTFAGVIEKIPYLQALGITHVEFLPVMAFDEQDVADSTFALGLRNYWGYNTYAFFAPHPSYCVDAAQAPREFRECVDALHAAGIGVLLDVVFNHTAEGGRSGPTINFKAIAGELFYHHESGDPSRYRDYTGCGNTVNCNHPLVTSFILRCLEYWTQELGVDGFRFDLASVFARGQDGTPLPDPPLTWGIELSPPLMRCKVIAEAWDAAGLYQVGTFPGMRWSEWNGRYRDVMRAFVRSDPGLVSEVAMRMAGSQDLYARRTPLSSVNFITCHDGFTLLDLVSYNHKHNERNGEDNRDGCYHNSSWNCGAEGDTQDAGIVALRHRQARNLLALLFLSQGTPMLLAGDEVLQTQCGNNNAYCQDNELAWFDWRCVESQHAMLRFVRELIALRKRHRSLRRSHFLTGKIGPQGMPDIAWHGERLHEPAWHDGNARLLAFTLAPATSDEPPLHVMLNMWWEPRTVDLPVLVDRRWYRAMDTALAAPEDILAPGSQPCVTAMTYAAQPRSVVVLEAYRDGDLGQD